MAKDITSQLNSQDHGIAGIMAESFIEEGQQALHQQAPLVYGQSVTDACLGWKDTGTLLAMLSDAVPPARQ